MIWFRRRLARMGALADICSGALVVMRALPGGIMVAALLIELAVPHAAAQPSPSGFLQRLGDAGLNASVRPSANGAEVTAVRSGSAADKSGIRRGDRIIRLNGRAVQSNADLEDRLFRARAGATLELSIDRNGSQLRASITLPAMPLEQFAHATVTLYEATSGAGDAVRVIVTRPKQVAVAPEPLPAVFVVGWLSCDSVEYPFGETDGFGALLRRIADTSHFVTVRVDKPGVGDSQGPPCRELDFNRELSAYRAAFASMARYSFIDQSRIFILGISNGGGFAPLVTRSNDAQPSSGKDVRGYVAAGGWARSWFEHMLEHERRRLLRSVQSGEDVDRAMKVFTEFYSAFLLQKEAPGAILTRHPDWRRFWYESDDGMYGRPAAFYQQLQELNLGDVWEHASAPALVIRGAEDLVMSRNDGEAIATILNRQRAGTATYREIEGADHLLMRGNAFADEVVPLVLEWLEHH